MAVDEPGQDREAGCIDGLGVARHRSRRALSRTCYVSVLDQDDGFARGLARGGMEETVRVDSPNQFRRVSHPKRDVVKRVLSLLRASKQVGEQTCKPKLVFVPTPALTDDQLPVNFGAGQSTDDGTRTFGVDVTPEVALNADDKGMKRAGSILFPAGQHPRHLGVWCRSTFEHCPDAALRLPLTPA